MNGPEALRWAADQVVGDDRVFDADHDNALVAARLTELADRIETVVVFTSPPCADPRQVTA